MHNPHEIGCAGPDIAGDDAGFFDEGLNMPSEPNVGRGLTKAIYHVDADGPAEELLFEVAGAKFFAVHYFEHGGTFWRLRKGETYAVQIETPNGTRRFHVGFVYRDIYRAPEVEQAFKDFMKLTLPDDENKYFTDDACRAVLEYLRVISRELAPVILAQ